MTEIAFHFNVPDKLAYSCRLLRKAYASGADIVVTGAADTLAELDQLLWTFSAPEFIGHCHLPGSGGGNATTIGASTLVLAESPRHCRHNGVLVNLGSHIPEEFERFERFIELVSQSDPDKQSARQRWKHYADRGYAMKRHDLAAVGGGA
ncbi:MAG: DNA polymerase III subunit chi [Pseudomonadota bacterium]